jgi:hypothetical protein
MGMTAFIGGSAFSAASGYNKAKSEKSSLNSQAWADRQNAQVADWQASLAIQNGQTEEEKSRLETAGVYGRERAAMGANGVDLGYGSANDILASTKFLGERDAMQIHDNALRTAWGYRTEGTNYRNKAAMEHAGANSIKPWMSAFGSLLGSASKSGFSSSDFSSFSSSNYAGESVGGSGMWAGGGGGL